MTQEEQNDLLRNYKELTTAHEKMSEQYAEYQSDNIALLDQYELLRREYAVVIRTVIKTLQAVGIWPVTDKIEISKVIKTVSSLAFDSMLPGSNIKERFAFIKDIIPIAERYKDIDVNTLE
jgi:hypothetical protein